MNTLTGLLFSFPLIVFTVLWSLLALYWILALMRLAPMELFERDSLKEDHLASAMVSLGFAGVPVSIALTTLVLLAGGLTLLLETLVFSRLSLGLFRVPLGVLTLWLAFALASPVASAICGRLHGMLHRHPGTSRRCLLGESVRVVDIGENGQARGVLDGADQRQVMLQGKPGAQPAPGERRVLVKYLRESDAYRSVLEQDYLDARTRLVRLHLVGRQPHNESRSTSRHGSHSDQDSVSSS